MSGRRKLQQAAIQLHTLSPNPVHCPLHRVQFSTSPRRFIQNRDAEESNTRDTPSGNTQFPSKPAFDMPAELPSPPSRPGLKIIVPDLSPATTTGNFHPESSAATSFKGSTISSSERENFFRIFDQMLIEPLSQPVSKRSVKIPPAAPQPRSKGHTALARQLDDAWFLTPKEVSQYPSSIQPLAAKMVREPRAQPEPKPVKAELPPSWPKFERTMNSCESDFDLSKFLDREVFPTMERPAQPNDVVRTNYGAILLKAMRLFRSAYRNPLAAHTLFLRAKTLSAESYVLGCTTSLYNELLLSRWESFTDLFSIGEILEEMNMNGLKGDRHTFEILQKVESDVNQWVHEGGEAAKIIWLAEKEKLDKLDKMKKEIQATLNSERDAATIEAKGPFEGAEPTVTIFR